jgi:hypothetical protein
LIRDSAHGVDISDVTCEHACPFSTVEVPFVNHLVGSSTEHPTRAVALSNDGCCAVHNWDNNIEVISSHGQWLDYLYTTFKVDSQSRLPLF